MINYRQSYIIEYQLFLTDNSVKGPEVIMTCADNKNNFSTLIRRKQKLLGIKRGRKAPLNKIEVEMPVNAWIDFREYWNVNDRRYVIRVNGRIVYKDRWELNRGGVKNIRIGSLPDGTKGFTGMIRDLAIWTPRKNPPEDATKLKQRFRRIYYWSGIEGEEPVVRGRRRG